MLVLPNGNIALLDVLASESHDRPCASCPSMLADQSQAPSAVLVTIEGSCALLVKATW
jgi:hypothetical protein